MTVDGTNGESLVGKIESYVDLRRAWLGEAVEIVTGDATTDLETVFEQPMQNPDERRRDSIALDLSTKQEARLREVAGRFGVGGEQDVTLESVGLPAGYISLIEGGLIWKMAAESEVNDDPDNEADDGASAYIFAGSPNRKLNDKELGFKIKRRLDAPALKGDITEYDAAQLVAESKDGYEALPEPVELPFGYDIQNSFAMSKSTGQLVHIGTRNGKPVMLLRVDREDYINEAGEAKYRKQPDTAALMGFVSDILDAFGYKETAVGMTTSNTYASRVFDAIRAGYSKGRQFGVAMYGRRTLAIAKGELKSGSKAEPTEINQIPTELRVMHDKLKQLDAAIHVEA